MAIICPEGAKATRRCVGGASSSRAVHQVDTESYVTDGALHQWAHARLDANRIPGQR
jgi:hypothetical protein